jgi:ATP-dependent protease ClpP protease subunit
MAKYCNSGESYADTRDALLNTFRDEAKCVMREHTEEPTTELVGLLLPKLVQLLPEDLFELADPAKHGIVSLHADIETETVAALQAQVMSVHLSIRKHIPLRLNVSSPGGDINAALALVSTLNEVRRDGRRVHIHVQGIAYSATSAIVQAADYRTIEAMASMMIHKSTWSMGRSTLDEHADMLRDSQRQLDTLFSLYSARTGQPVSYYRAAVHKKDWVLSARQTLAEGLVDKVLAVPGFK